MISDSNLSFSERRQARPKAASRRFQTTATALSLEKFDPATIEEAKAVIAGRSHWFSFDEDGVLTTLHPHDSMEYAAARREEAATMRDISANPAHYEKMLADIRQNGSSREHIEKTEIQIEALTKEYEALKSQTSQTEIDRARIDLLSDRIYSLEGRLQQQEEELPDKQREEISHLNRLTAQAPYISHHDEKLAALQEAMLNPPTDEEEKNHLKQEAWLLESAAYAFSNPYVLIEKLEQVLAPLDYKSELSSSRDTWQSNADQISLTFTPKRRELFRALTALLGQTVRASSTLEAQDMFDQQVDLSVRSKNMPLLGFLDDGTENYSTLRGTLDQHMESLRGILHQFTQVTTGQVTPSEEEREENRQNAQNGGIDMYSPTALLREALSDASVLRNQDYMRLHNSFPEAVNFIRASEDAEFLLAYTGRKQQIPNAASFIDSPWIHMAGGVELKVSPQLLEQTREALQGPSR